MIKSFFKFLIRWLIIILLLLAAGIWFVNSDVGDGYNFIKTNKNDVKVGASTYMNDKKNEVISKALNKLGYESNSPNTSVPLTPVVVNNPDAKSGKTIVSPVDSKGVRKVDPSSTDEVKTLTPEIVKSEFTHLSIPFFYDHSSAPTNISKEDVLALVSKASQTWNEACNISFDYKGDRYSDYVDQNNTINRREGLIKWGQLSGGAIGQAHQGNGRGPALGFVLTLKASFFQNKENQKFLYPTMLHELSHVIGLGHSKNPTSIMYWQQTNRQQTLNDTDKVMCKYYRARWQGLSIQQASDKYGVLVNESAHSQEVETNSDDDEE